MKRLILLALVGFSFFALSIATASDEETGEMAAQALKHAAEAPSVNFDEELLRIARADSDAAIMKVSEEAASRCGACEDFGKFANGVKKVISDKPNFKYISALYYVVAKARLDELACLSSKGDIESGRLYMSLNDEYRNEANECLDKALKDAKSKDLMLDISFLKFLATKEEFQSQKIEEFLNDMADKIAKYSDDAALNKRQLDRMSDEFISKGFGPYALRLKIAYAKRLDPKFAQEVFEDIRKDGDKNFAQGNARGANAIYDAYMEAAQGYFTKDVMAGKVMEIAEKYFGANRYSDARKYYESYAVNYPDSNVMDYCKYKTALCLSFEKSYAKAVAALEEFLGTYQNSVWFDRAFETLARIYFSNFPKDVAMSGLEKLVGSHYRKNVGDFGYMLMGLLHYVDKEYNKALEDFKKVDLNSVYSYAADTMIAEIKDIKNGSKPSYSFGSKERYRMWEPGKQITIDMVPMEAGDAKAWLKGSSKGEDKKLEITYTASGAPKVTVKPGAKIRFALAALSDEDKFSEYMQDKEDLSRLPKLVKEDNEKDLLILQWGCEGGKYVDERQTRDKPWQAPDEPGLYKISIAVDDFGLVRTPDKGIRKDPAKDFSLIINVEGG